MFDSDIFSFLGEYTEEYAPILLTLACVGSIICPVLVLIGCAEFCRRHSGFKVRNNGP